MLKTVLTEKMAYSFKNYESNMIELGITLTG